MADLPARNARIYQRFTHLDADHQYTSRMALYTALGVEFGGAKPLSPNTIRRILTEQRSLRQNTTPAASNAPSSDLPHLPAITPPEAAHNPFPDKKHPTPITFERVLDEIKRKQRYVEDNSYSQDEATWIPQPEYPTLPIAVVWMPDIHFGSIDVDYAFLERHLKIIQTTPNMYVAFGGDMINSFNAVKIPEGIWHDGVTPEDQMKGWANLMERFDRAHKIAALTWGNHDEFSKMAGINAFSAFFGIVSCPMFIDGGGVLHTKVGAQTYHLGMRHTFWGNSKINLTNASKRMLAFWREGLDAAMLGHVHTAAGEDLTFGGQQKIAIVGGTWKLNDGFSRRWVGDPQPGGFTLLMYPNKRHMQLCRYPEDAADILLGKIARLPKDREPKVVPFERAA